jgi:glycerol-3-phosphate dehydrogenase
MRKEVLVIGGGATGAGVVRDLALRGADCVLLEMGDYCHGASGGNHGLLHSGGRYAVKDPSSARECAEENSTLRRIAPFCIEDTGGLFASLPEDDPEFGDRFERACRETGVPVEELSAREALAEEPGLSTEVTRCYRVPDGSVDPFALVQANVEDARANGATVLNHCRVTGMEVDGGRVVRVDYVNNRNGGSGHVVPELMVNAAGAWAPQVAKMAGVRLAMGLDQGSMLVADGRHCRHVVNRLRPPSNGDIAVPNHTSTILGTTSRPASSPEDSGVSEADHDLLLRETSRMLPGLRTARVIRSYGGVRPLLGGGGREASRSFAVLRDEGAENMITVSGGKLTTYRLMAEKVSDQACRVLGIRAACRTASEPLGPPAEGGGMSIAESRLTRKYGWRSRDIDTGDARVICSCEQVLRSEVVHALGGEDVLTMADVMRRTRAGMGYCQGIDCSLGVLELMVRSKGVDPRQALLEFLSEREKGLELASGDQLRQELLRRHLFQGVYGLGGGA